MRFDQKRPCAECPFLRTAGGYLHPVRAREIAENMLDWNGQTFQCHKTLHIAEKRFGKADAQHCAGALIFAEKNDVMTQAMRMAGRLGIYEPGLADNGRQSARVYDSAAEMIRAHADQVRPRIKKPR